VSLRRRRPGCGAGASRRAARTRPGDPGEILRSARHARPVTAIRRVRVGLARPGCRASPAPDPHSTRFERRRQEQHIMTVRRTQGLSVIRGAVRTTRDAGGTSG
jgi:hypothetical protein